MREIVVRVIMTSTNMENRRKELTRIERVRRGEVIRNELFVRLKREKDRKLQIETRERMRDWKMCESEVWECVESAIQESEVASERKVVWRKRYKKKRESET